MDEAAGEHHRHEQRTDVPYLHAISQEAMEATYETLTALMDEYFEDSPMFAAFCEARRLVEYEIRVRFGDQVWSRLTSGGEE